MLGLMFYEPSSRYIDPHQAQALLDFIKEGERSHTVMADDVVSQNNPDIRRGRFIAPIADSSALAESRLTHSIAPDIVGVFVNKDAACINEITQQVGLHIVQLHGDETPEFCHSITRPVVKALRLQDISDIGKLRAYREVAWRILLDTPAPGWGGTGITHDWTIARAASQEAPILLAGGLTPENVAEAIQQVHPWGVDVSSGVETNGHKDISKIRAFIKNVREEGQMPQ